MRNLDIAQLRALLAVVQYGGVGHAANMLHLTQSAVSMQIKRLEESLDSALFFREKRRLKLTPKGEVVASHARKVIALNDEIVSRMRVEEYVEELSLGIPSDMVEPYMLNILTQFRKMHPKVLVRPAFGISHELKKLFEAGKLDLLITTEKKGTGKELTRRDLHWYALSAGEAPYARPLRIAMIETCAFHEIAQRALNAVDLPFEFYPNLHDCQVEPVLVEADLAVMIALSNEKLSPQLSRVANAILPELPDIGVYLYQNEALTSLPLNDLAAIVENVYAELPA